MAKSVFLKRGTNLIKTSFQALEQNSMNSGILSRVDLTLNKAQDIYRAIQGLQTKSIAIDVRFIHFAGVVPGKQAHQGLCSYSSYTNQCRMIT